MINDINESEESFCEDKKKQDLYLHSDATNTDDSGSLDNNSKKQKKDKKIIKTTKLTKNEKNIKNFSLNSFRTFFSSGGWLLLILVSVFLFIIQIFRIIIDYWIAAWAVTKFNLSTNEYFNIYMSLILIIIISGALFCYTFANFVKISAYNLFKNFLDKILVKKMTFFDITPIGQILNLVSRDLSYLDYFIPSNIHNLITIALRLFIFINLIIINSVVILPFVFLYIVIIYFTMKIYIKISLDLVKLEQNAYSPIISNISEAHNGIIVLKNYNKLNYLKNIFTKNVDYLSNVYYHNNSLKIFNEFILQISNGLLVWFSIFFVIIGKNLNWSFVVQDPNLVGLSLNYMFLSIMIVNMALLTFTDFLIYFTSAERVFRNIEDDLDERNYELPESKTNWPSKGSLIAKGVNIRYQKHMPLVLKNLNFEIKSGEKIGIVGRTGSGKSTLILALTRILELDKEGEDNFISIDGVKTFALGMKHVRKNIKVIPQDPFLLRGTLRFNIDPLNKHDDATVIDVLKKCLIWNSTFFNEDKNRNKKENVIIMDEGTDVFLEQNLEGSLMTVSDLEGESEKTVEITDKEKLSFFIEDQGRNLSVGQKQLICIGRALIEKPKILLLDEATSSIDSNNDYRIQKTLKNEFKDTTIITIAHRLNTIIFYDNIFLLDNGSIIEKGSPYELLMKEDSNFKKLIMEFGINFYDQMLESAKNKNILRFN